MATWVSRTASEPTALARYARPRGTSYFASADLVRVLGVTVPGQPQVASELPLATIGSLAAERTEASA